MFSISAFKFKRFFQHSRLEKTYSSLMMILSLLSIFNINYVRYQTYIHSIEKLSVKKVVDIKYFNDEMMNVYFCHINFLNKEFRKKSKNNQKNSKRTKGR